MDSDNSFRNLMFLFSVAPLSLGCIITTSGDDDGNSESSGNPPTSTTSATGDGSTSAGTGDGSTSAATTGTTASMDTASGTAADDTTTATTGTVDPCTAYADHVSYDCIGDPKAYDGYADYCATNVAYAEAISKECGAATEAVFACLAVTNCDTLFMGDPCPDEIAAADEACIPK